MRRSSRTHLGDDGELAARLGGPSPGVGAYSEALISDGLEKRAKRGAYLLLLQRREFQIPTRCARGTSGSRYPAVVALALALLRSHDIKRTLQGNSPAIPLTHLVFLRFPIPLGGFPQRPVLRHLLRELTLADIKRSIATEPASAALPLALT